MLVVVLVSESKWSVTSGTIGIRGRRLICTICKICTNHNALKASEKSRTYIPGDLEVASFEEEVCPILATCSSCESRVVCVSTCTGGKVMRSYDCYWWLYG